LDTATRRGLPRNFEFIRQSRYCYPVENIFKVLGVSKSGYYSWNRRKPSRRALHNLALIEQIKITLPEQEKIRQSEDSKRTGGLRLSCIGKTGQETDETDIPAECL